MPAPTRRSAKPPAPPKVLETYGLAALGYADAIPMTGDYTRDQLAVEMLCYRISHRRSEGGLDRFGHMKRGIDLLWNNPENSSQKKFIWNPWAEKMLREMCECDELGIAGPTSAGKSDPAAIYAVWSYICDPSACLVLILSTTLKGAKKRIWKTLREYWEGIPNLPGKPLWSTNEIQGMNYNGDGYSQSSGIYLMASEQSSEKDAMDKLIGIKSPRIGEFGASFEELVESDEYRDLKEQFDEEYLRDLIPRLQNLSGNRIGKLIMLIDECTGCSESIWNTVQSNLKPGNVGSFQLITIANPSSRLDCFGVACKPADGWESVDENDYEWETASGGKCIRFNGEKNPRITERNEKFSWMLRAEDIQNMKDTYGENSPYYWRMAKGFWAPGGSETGVYSEADIISSGALGKAVWGYEEPVMLSALDPAWAAGGDKASCSFGKVGKDPSGKKIVELTEEITLKIDITDERVSPSYQIVRQWRRECLKRGVLPHNTVFDATGGGGPFGDIVRMEWSQAPLAVSSGGKASKERVGAEKDSNGNPILGSERFFNRMTELWMGAMPFFRSKQIKGVTEHLAKQICSRQYDKGGQSDGRTLRVESKRIYKAREGSSPDESDSFMLLIELAKKRHGLRAAEKPPEESAESKGGVSWDHFRQKARRITKARSLTKR